MKFCPKCGQSLLLDSFTNDKNRKDGKYPYCKDCRKVNDKKYRESGKHNENCKKYNKTDKGKESLSKAVEKYRKTENYKKSWNKTNKKKRLSQAISVRMNQSLKGCKYNRHWEDLVGYTLQDLKEHLESQFIDGMSWKNHGISGWHIDHIRPIDSFDIVDYDCSDFKKCWSLDNLQPLWAKDNMEKSNRYEI